MKLLILGANGQVGYELNQHCGSDTDCIALGREQVDFSQPGNITRVVEEYKPDAVINAVAYTAVDKAETEPSLAMQINAIAVQELARSCQTLDAWCIHYSTDYVFDGKADKPYQEIDTVSPLGIYGLTKHAGERLIQQSTDKFIILRTSWVYSWRGANFVKTMLRLGAERDQLTIVNDQIGCPTYAVDIAAATQTIIAKIADDKSYTGIYHLTGSDQTSWYEFAKAIFFHTNQSISIQPIPTRDFPTPAKRPHYSVLDNTKLEQTFGISLPGYKDSLKHCLSRCA